MLPDVVIAELVKDCAAIFTFSRSWRLEVITIKHALENSATVLELVGERSNV